MALTQVKTSGIADDAVTLAKQAGGTDGNLITYYASGNPTVVATGNDGQVLTSQGAGNVPQFETPAPGVGGATGVDFNDGVEIRLGTSNDAVIDYDGGGDELLLKTSTAGSNIRLDGKSYLDLYVDGAQKLLVSPTYGLQSAYDLTITGPDGNTGAKIVLSEDSGLVNSKATIQASSSMTENVQITLPTAAPASNGLSLTATTAGVTSWATPAIPDNAVDLDAMAGGTDGNLITYDTNGDPAHVATGSSGHVLTSNGAGAAPTFQATTAATATSGTDNFTVSDGDLVIATSGHGIDFSATGNASGGSASMSSELLDHYEEGSFTPKMTASVDFTMSHQEGAYTRVGNIVTVYLRVGWSSTNSATGGITLRDFPYNIKSNNGGYYQTGCFFDFWGFFPDGYNLIYGPGNTNYWYFGETHGASPMNCTDIGGGNGGFSMSVTYLCND